MKICYIANGESIHTKRWLKWFVDHGHKIYLITNNVSNIVGLEKEYLIPFHKKGGYIPRISYILRIRKIIKKIQPDILHSHFIFTHGMYGALSGFHPFVVTGWGSDVLAIPKRSFYHKFLVKYILGKADFVTVFSKHLYESILELGVNQNNLEIIVPWDESIYLKYNREILDSLKKELSIPSDSFIVLSPRNIQPLYRTDIILNSIPYILEKHPNSYFVFLKGLSDEKYFNKILTIIDQLSIRNNVRIISRWLNNDEMAALFNLSKAFISIPQIDQFALTVREGMICNSLPIIGKLEIYDHLLNEKNAIFVSGDDSKQLSEKISYIIENPNEVKEIIGKNRIFIQKHQSIENKLDEMKRIYYKLSKSL